MIKTLKFWIAVVNMGYISTLFAYWLVLDTLCPSSELEIDFIVSKRRFRRCDHISRNSRRFDAGPGVETVRFRSFQRRIPALCTDLSTVPVLPILARSTVTDDRTAIGVVSPDSDSDVTVTPSTNI